MWIEAALAPVARVRGARRLAPYRRASRPLPRASRTSLPGSVRTASQYLRKDDRRSRTPAQAGPGAHSGWRRRTVDTTSTSGARFSRASAVRTAAQVLPGTGPLPRLFSTGWWIPSTKCRAHRADLRHAPDDTDHPSIGRVSSLGDDRDGGSSDHQPAPTGAGHRHPH